MNSKLEEKCEQISRSAASATRKLLDARVEKGYWEGELSSSPLSTATAVLSLALFLRKGKGRLNPTLLATCRRLITQGTAWLVKARNSDGGFGDTVESPSNLSTTTLVWAALTAVEENHDQTLASTRQWLTTSAGGVDVNALAASITARYGEDRTFSAPILTACALAGAFGSNIGVWRQIPQLPFELALFSPRWLKWLRLPVVSYALPALIAIGQIRHRFHPTKNPVLHLIRSLAQQKNLKLLKTIQPKSGGYLEAIPLTSFVIMSLVASNQVEHPVVTKGLNFLVATARPDGSWPIDTNLATWVTTQSLAALAAGRNLRSQLRVDERRNLRSWLLAQQYHSLHPFTHAEPGGWAWTDLPGGVPDADDTAGALLALSHLGDTSTESMKAACSGIDWLVDLQNSDGGIPTFCRGWGRLPFDRSSPDITAHTLLAWSIWQDAIPPRLRSRLYSASRHALDYLSRAQREDGAWVPLWFGNQAAPDEENPTYGTARVVLALNRLSLDSRYRIEEMKNRGIRWLLDVQNRNGGWGGAKEVYSTIEETALAVQALADTLEVTPATAENTRSSLELAVSKGVCWLISETQEGRVFKSSPIGLYFSKLWYCERQYPIVFTVAALGRAASAAYRCTLSKTTAIGAGNK